MFKTGKILYKQMELLAKDSGNCMPGELPKNSQAMAELNKELFKHRCASFIFLCFCHYLVRNFAKFVIEFCRR